MNYTCITFHSQNFFVELEGNADHLLWTVHSKENGKCLTFFYTYNKEDYAKTCNFLSTMPSLEQLITFVFYGTKQTV